MAGRMECAGYFYTSLDRNGNNIAFTLVRLIMRKSDPRSLMFRWRAILLPFLVISTLLLAGCGPDEVKPMAKPTETPPVRTPVVEVATVPVETVEVDEAVQTLEALAADIQSDDEETILAAFEAIDEELKSESPEAAIALLEENAAVLIGLMAHESIEICRGATWMLANVETEAAFEAIYAAVDHPDFGVRMSVLWELVEREDPRAVDALVAAFSPDSEIEPAFLYMLLDKMDDGAEEVLIRSLEVADASLLPEITERLVDLGSEAAIPYLIELLDREDFDDRVGVIEVLGEIGDPAALPTLLSMLEEEDVKIRTAAVVALGNFDDPAVFEALVELLEDDAPVLQKAAAKTLCNLSEATLAPLFDALWSLDLEMVAKTYRFFIAWGEPGSEGIMIMALNDYGNKSMALAFLNSGNEALEAAGKTWANAHGYNVVTMPSVGGSSGGWGSGQ
jgi:HEAT repeat protein